MPTCCHLRAVRPGAIVRDMTEYRIEHDTMGEIKVPADALWRAQTQRAVENFPISGTPIESAQIRALAQIKAACAKANAELGILEQDMADAIVAAAEEVATGAARRPVPDRRLPDRLGHVEQHEHQRGPRLAGHEVARPRRPPQRPRERQPVVQRRLPDLDPRRRHGVGHERADPGARPPRPVAGGARPRSSPRSSSPGART